MTPLVVDASALVALLTDEGDAGTWAQERLAGVALCAPQLARVEAANVLRRLELSRELSADAAAQAHADLLDLAIEEWPHALLAGRAWELRANLTVYDASYVALAELLGAALVTLDVRIGRAPGLRCEMLVPDR